MLNNWDDAPNLQDVMDAIHAEIKEYGFSKTWQGSVKVYETLKFHLQRMSGFAPYDIKQTPEEIAAGFIRVQFSGPAEQRFSGPVEQKFDGVGRAPLSVNGHDAARVKIDVRHQASGVNHNTVQSIKDEVSANAISSLWKGSYTEYAEIVEELALHGILPIGGYHIEGVKFKPSGKVPATINRIPVKQTAFWHRKGQYSVRVSAVISISGVSDGSYTVYMKHRMHITMKFQSDKAAKTARRSLMVALDTRRP